LYTQGLQAQAQTICRSLQLRKAVGAVCALKMMFDDGCALIRIWLPCPSLATHLRHIEIGRHQPSKVVLHGSIKIARLAGVIVGLTGRHCEGPYDSKNVPNSKSLA
jgi:hypothetical protein